MVAPTRPRLGPEPTPPLRAVTDLPLRIGDLSAEIRERVESLSARVTKKPAEGEWPEVYEDAIAIVEELVGDVESKVEEVQKELLSLDDPNEVRQRVTQGPRREAEKSKNDARSAVQRVTKDWADRGKRQLEHVLSECTSSANKSMKVTTEDSKNGVKLGVDQTWWAQLSGYLARCCDDWTRNVTTGAEEAFSRGVGEATSPLLERTGGKGVKRPPTLADPRNEAKLKNDPPDKEADVPSFAAALGGYVRSNIMAVGMFATIIAVVIALGGRFLGSGDASSARPNTMLVRGGMLLAVLPVILILGARAARKQRETQRDKALSQHQQAVRGHLEKEMKAVLENHRGALERWVAARGESWASALEGWWDDAVEPALARTADEAAVTLKDLRLRQTKLQDRQSSLRALKNQIGGNLLFDLRKRQREYQQLLEEG